MAIMSAGFAHEELANLGFMRMWISENMTFEAGLASQLERIEGNKGGIARTIIEVPEIITSIYVLHGPEEAKLTRKGKC